MAANLKIVEEIDPDEVELRAELHTAIEQSEAALKLRDKAKATVEAVRAHLAEVEEELRQFETLDADIAEARAVQIAELLEAGGGFPALKTPPELERLSLKRADASNRHAAIIQAATRLRGNLDDAQATLDRTQADVEHAARAVVGHIADGLARDLAAREAECAKLRRHLTGASALRPGQQIPLSRETLSLLRDGPAGALVSHNDVSGAAAWNRLFAALSKDGAATMPDEF